MAWVYYITVKDVTGNWEGYLRRSYASELGQPIEYHFGALYGFDTSMTVVREAMIDPLVLNDARAVSLVNELTKEYPAFIWGMAIFSLKI